MGDGRSLEVTVAPKKVKRVAWEDALVFPLHLLDDLPPLIADLVEWSAKSAYVVQPALDLCTALMCGAQLMQNKYEVKPRGTPIQPYFMMVARTSEGKNSRLKLLDRFLLEMELSDYAMQSVMSHHALYEHLEQTGHAILIQDEFPDMLKNHKNHLTSEIITAFIKVYGNSLDPISPFLGKNSNIGRIDTPFFCAFTGAQGENLMESIKGTHFTQGLINRFVFFDVGERPSPSHEGQRLQMSQLLKNKLMTMSKWILHQTDIVPIKMTQEAYDAYRIIDDGARMIEDKIAHDLKARMGQNMIMICGILACFVNHEKPLITIKEIRWAETLLNWSYNSMLSRLDQRLNPTTYGRAREQVQDLLQHPTKFAKRKGLSPNQARILKKGIVPKACFNKFLGDISPNMRKDILDDLAVGELIGHGFHGEGVKKCEVYWWNND